jgi:uncharacterized protein YqeY
VTVLDQLRADVNRAVKARDRELAGALRLVISELQRDAKEGPGDELAVLRRERKRRLDAAAAFRDGGRPELAEREEAEARIIERYLPAELDDAELRRIVQDAIESTGAAGPRDMGAVMRVVMQRSEGRAEGGRAAEIVRAALAGSGSG